MPLTSDSTADVVVIGAGVMGASVAFHLTRAGVHRVAILDKGAAVSGMTSRSGALVRMHYTYEPEAKLALASLPYFREWSDRVGHGDCGFVETGALCVVGPENEARMRRAIAMLRGIGVDTIGVAPDEMRKLYPGIDTHDLALGAYEPWSGYADPIATARAFLEGAQKSGARLHEGVEVKAILSDPTGATTGVETVGGAKIESKVVVVTAGPWSDRLLTPLGTAIGIHAERAQIAFFKRPPVLPKQPVYIDCAIGLYGRPHGNDLSLAGLGTFKRPPAPPDPDTFDVENDPDFIEAVRERTGRRFKAMAGAAYERGHAGIYDLTTDTRAVLDQPRPGLFLAAGFSGTGFKKSPAVGLGLAEWITTGRLPKKVDFAPFRLSRFAEGKPIGSPDEYVLPVDFGHRL
jgi:sarcosine oxidase subunit beta